MQLRFGLLRFLGTTILGLGVGAMVGTACISVEYPVVAFRCSPRLDSNCPESHFCCSDDPATIEGRLPQFVDRPAIGGAGDPLFAGVNNGRGTSGMCVRTDDIPVSAGLKEPEASRCPVPCNPTWDEGQVIAVCGPELSCCQTTELEPEDCVIDPMSGDWRPAVGGDVYVDAVGTSWAPGRHATNQDPSGNGCAQYAGTADPNNPDFKACVTQLSVADQRGFCRVVKPGEVCLPGLLGGDPTIVDACTALNNGAAPPE